MTTRGQTIRCKGAVCWSPGEPLVIQEVDVAPPQAWEVRIKIICTALCHTDVQFWKIETPFSRFPKIFGHEAVGVVESVGDSVREVKEGDRVIPCFVPTCGECVSCRSEKGNHCSKFPSVLMNGMLRDDTSRFSTTDGTAVHHFFCVSSFAEYTVVDVATVVKVDFDIPPEKACLLGCGVTTGFGAAWKAANVERGSKVAIFGLGAVGLAVAMGAKNQGASQIIGIDLNPRKFEIGKKVGVTDFINPKECGDKSLSQVITEISHGGVDYSFECIGIESYVQEAFDSTHMELNLDPFITHHVSLHEINKAFDLLRQGESIRCIIWMN